MFGGEITREDGRSEVCVLLGGDDSGATFGRSIVFESTTPTEWGARRKAALGRLVPETSHREVIDRHMKIAGKDTQKADQRPVFLREVRAECSGSPRGSLRR